MYKELTVVIGLIVAVLSLAIYATYQDNKHWEEFSKVHACKLVAHNQGQTHLASGFSASGKYVVGTVTDDSTDSYLCDDGVTYTR